MGPNLRLENILCMNNELDKYLDKLEIDDVLIS